MKKHFTVIGTGVFVGIAALVLVSFGNPANMGFCIACFLRDIAGSLKLHNAGVVQYMRPEIIGMLIGAFIIAFAKKEFRPRGGSAPFTRFVLGFFVMIGALMFLGCPLRMFLRLGAGDLNAILGLVGFIAGIGIGVLFLNRNFSLSRAYPQSKSEGLIPVIVMFVFLIILIAFPAVLAFSKKGPGAMYAPIWISLAIGLVVGIFSQRSRMCTAGGIRDAIMLKDFHLLYGSIAILVTTIIGTIILGLTGEGNTDSAITIVGLIAGAAFAHNFKLAATPKGPSSAGMIAVILGLLVTLAISLYYSIKNSKKA